MKLTKEQRDKIADEFLIFAKQINNREINQVGLLVNRIDRIEQILTPAPPEGRELKLELYEKCEDCAGSGAVYERDDNGDPYLDRCFKCNGEGYIKFIPAAPPRSAEEILNEFYMKNLRCTGAMFLPMEVAIEAMHAYASQFRREVTDEEIEDVMTTTINAYPFDVMKRIQPKMIEPTKRLCITSAVEGAKWMRSKMTGE